MTWRTELDEIEYQALNRVDRSLQELHRRCLKQAEICGEAGAPAEQDAWVKIVADIAERTARIYLTLNDRYPGRSGDSYAIITHLGHAWISRSLRDVGTVRGLGLLAQCRGMTPALEAVSEAASTAYQALVSLDDAHTANERRHAEAGRFKPRRFIAVPADADSTSKIRGFGFTAEEALDNAYKAAGCKYRPYIRYDERASGEKFAHLLPVSETEGWVAFDGHANEIGAFFEEAVAQRAATKAGFIARQCVQAEVMEALESGLTLAA